MTSVLTLEFLWAYLRCLAAFVAYFALIGALGLLAKYAILGPDRP